MIASSEALVWLDMEMTGLDPVKEAIIEVATIITDGQLLEIAMGPTIVVFQPPEVLAAMDAWNQSHHGASGLLEKVRASSLTVADAEAQTLAFLQSQLTGKDRPVLAGNSIHQDRRFIRKYMPALDAYLHYRMVDVSTVKELARRWYPDVVKAQPGKKESHRAADDIRESIEELRYYRNSLFLKPPA